MNEQTKQTIYIEAFALLGDHPSGIAKLLFSTVKAMSENPEVCEKYDIYLLVPIGKKRLLDKWGLPESIHIKTLPLPIRAINLLQKVHLMPPLELFCGNGYYIFPNYRRLPLLASRSITYVHDAVFDLYPETVLDKNLAFLKRVIPEAVKKSNKIVTLSKQSKSDLSRLFPDYIDKISIVPCGIDTNIYRPDTIDDNSWKQVLKRQNLESKKYLLFVGNIEPRKNVLYLLEVYKLLVDNKKISSDTSLFLVGGDGWNNQAILQRIAELQATGYKVARPEDRVSDGDLGTLYHHSLLTLHLPLYEGFGMTPLEALAAGARVIVSDIPVLREVCGESVTYVPVNQLDVAFHMISEVLNDSSETDLRVIKNILDTYTWEKSVQQLMAIIAKTK